MMFNVKFDHGMLCEFVNIYGNEMCPVTISLIVCITYVNSINDELFVLLLLSQWLVCILYWSDAGVLMADSEPSSIHMYGHEGGMTYRKPGGAPLRKLTVDLIKTYRKINEVCVCVCIYRLYPFAS